MRIIKLYLEDHELFVKDVDPDDYGFYQSHIATFKRMWKDQGSTFWLRFLITFREHVKNYTFEYQKLLDKKWDLPICAHVLSHCLDEAFIHIHKEFLEGDCGSAKSLLCDIFTLAKNRHLITELESTSFVYDPFYSKSTRDSFRKLFGDPPVNRKASILKVWLTCPVYLKFGGACCTVLRRWLTENDICDKDIPDVNNKYQYWMPYDNWTKKNFVPEPFEDHIAKFWEDQLPSMLLTTNIKNIFLRGMQEKCSCASERISSGKDSSCDLTLQSMSSQTFGTPCKRHDNCLVKIIHGPDCVDPQFCNGRSHCLVNCESVDPQFCSGRSHCLVSCESEIKKAIVGPASKGISDTEENSYWKSFEVFIEPCDKENCRNVGTLCETHNSSVESYLIPEKALFAKNICDFIHGACDFPPNLPPETLNALMQVRRVEGTRERLRNKLLDKKQKLLGEKRLHDPAYRMKMYEQALEKFRKEMEAEAHLCGCNSWKDHARDTCKGLQIESSQKKSSKRKNKNDEKEGSHLLCKSRGVAIITTTVVNSVAVGTDERSGIGKVLEARKKCPKKTKNNNKHSDEKNTENGKTLTNDFNSVCDDKSVNDSAQMPSKDQISLSHSNCTERTETDLMSETSGINNSCVVKEICSSECSGAVAEDSIPENVKMDVPINDRDVTVESTTVSKNMDVLEKAILENGGLGHDEIMLMLKTTEMLMGNETSNKTENKDNSNYNTKGEEPPKKKGKLHVCAYCKVKETEPSVFKKCSRCKKEKFPEPRYYCSRECQVEDWEESHRDEHQRNAAPH